MTYTSLSEIIMKADGDEQLIKQTKGLDYDLLPFVWIDIMKSEIPLWMIRENTKDMIYDGYTLAMWWLMKVNNNVPKWMQHDANYKNKYDETCLILWLKLYKTFPPDWILKDYNFTAHEYDYEGAWNQRGFTSKTSAYYIPSWLSGLEPTEFEKDYKIISANMNKIKDTMYYKYSATDGVEHQKYTTKLIVKLSNIHLQQPSLRFILFYHELYVYTERGYRPLKEFYGLSIKVPTIEYLKDNSLDNISKLLVIIFEHRCNNIIIEECGIFKYYPNHLWSQYILITRLLRETDYNYIYGSNKNKLPPRTDYDCEIKGSNIRYYLEQGLTQNKVLIHDVLERKYDDDAPHKKPQYIIDYEFYEKYKQQIHVGDIKILKRMIQYYIENNKQIPSELYLN